MLQNLFSLTGRISRLEYFLSVVIVILCFFILKGLLGYSLIMFLTMVPAFIFLIVQSIKRSHDMGISPWWLFVPLYFLFLIVSEGQTGENQFGPEPRRIQYASGGYSDGDFDDIGDCDSDAGDGGGDGGVD